MSPPREDQQTVSLTEQFGQIDIYLFDQLLRGRITPDMTVLDAGCGNGRNLVYLLRQGCRVFGVDASVHAVNETRALARRLVPDTPAERFRVERLEAMSFDHGSFDAVICSAVLHFAEGQSHFASMLDELWRVLAPGGLLFTRLASSIGLEDRVVSIGSDRFRLPDGTDRYLVDEATLLEATERLGGRLADPIKTTNVAGQRCMTTWCVWKQPLRTHEQSGVPSTRLRAGRRDLRHDRATEHRSW
jgi:SAM-dependent methyltransferase